MKVRSYCEKIGHQVVGRLNLVANTKAGTRRTYQDEARNLYTVDTVTGKICVTCYASNKKGRDHDNK